MLYLDFSIILKRYKYGLRIAVSESVNMYA